MKTLDAIEELMTTAATQFGVEIEEFHGLRLKNVKTIYDDVDTCDGDRSDRKSVRLEKELVA